MSTLLPVAPVLAAPRLLTVEPALSDAEFEEFCRANDTVRIERTREGVIRMNPPTGPFTSDGNSELNAQLRAWWKTHRQGRVFDSNAGFYLPDGSMLSPDSAYITADKAKRSMKRDMQGFLHAYPDFAIELLSPSDRLKEAKAKMERWIANGVELAWLIDPTHRQVWVYRLGAVSEIKDALSIHGEGPVAGFTLDLEQVWDCYDV